MANDIRGVKMIDQEQKAAFAKMTIGAGGAAAAYLTLSDWVAILTIVYASLQIGLLLPKYWRAARDFAKRRKWF